MARLRRGWKAWTVVSAGLAGYASLAQIAAHTVATPLKLKPAAATEVTLFRLTEDTLRFDLVFAARGCEQRPELGSWASTRQADLLTLRPGVEVRILAGSQAQPPLEYDAMPLGGHCSDRNPREMTANLPVRPGVYRWPPPSSTPAIKLHAGFNTVRFAVTKVGEPLTGETVNLEVQPPLGVKSGSASVQWLWFGILLWPVFLAVQLAWAAWWLVVQRRSRSPAQRGDIRA